MKAIIVDIDGTLSDVDHRLHLIKDPQKKDYDKFYSKLGDDEPKGDIIELVNCLSKCYYTILLTGRPNEYRKKTVDWLDKFGVHYDILFMRPTDDYRPDNVLKKEIYEERIKPHFEVLVVLDDRTRVVDMWREIGLTALQVDYWDDEEQG